MNGKNKDRMMGMMGAGKKFLSADDVPPSESWPPKTKPKINLPMRQYYYDLQSSISQGNDIAAAFKMATATNVGQSKASADETKPGPFGSQIVSTTTIGDDTTKSKKMPHCKACTDFKTWMELTANPRRQMSKEERERKQCPLDSELLGSNTWSFLHTMAAYYPEKPTFEQQHNMKSFITLMSQFYPCHICAAHLREDLKSNPPDTGSNKRLSHWFCSAHNRVNERLGKPIFDCSKVIERWRDGWADNSCD